MKLNYKEFGQGEPLLILHGLFGTLDNWQTLAKRFAENYTVYIIDQRNHGRSPHIEEHSYPILAEDLREFMEEHFMYKANILGHSMGGKAAMQFAMTYPEMVNKLVVVDISLRKNEVGHTDIFKALFSLNLDEIKDRKEADKQLEVLVPEYGTRQFLLKNLTRKKEGGYEWKMNLKVLFEEYEEVLAAVKGGEILEEPALFIRGGKSDYVRDEDWAEVIEFFPQAQLKTVKNAGHWVHAEQPEELFHLVFDFLNAEE